MDLLTSGLKLFYTSAGNPENPSIVFIHGFPFSQRMWNEQVDLVKGDFFAVTFDIRGHGQSETGDGQYLLEFFVDDLIALLDTLGIKQTVLCGLSMGGYVALRAMERQPERVRGLVLCDTRSEADSNEAKLKRAASIKTVKKDGVAVFAEGFLKAVFSPRSLQERKSAVDFIRQIMIGNSATGICGTLLALAGRTDTTASLSKMNVPALILVGEHDSVTPPAAAEAMHQQIRGSEFHVIPDAGHLSNLENPALFNQHLITFLKKQL